MPSQKEDENLKSFDNNILVFHKETHKSKNVHNGRDT